MEGTAEGDDATATGGGAGNLDGVLDGFGTRGDEDGLPGTVDGHDLVETLGQTHIAVIGGDLVAHVRELLELLARSPDDLGMAMAGVDDGNAGRKVDVAAAFGVPEFRVAGTFCEQGGHHAHAAGDGGSPALGQGFLAHDGSPRWMDKVVVGRDDTRGRPQGQLTLSCISERCLGHAALCRVVQARLSRLLSGKPALAIPQQTVMLRLPPWANTHERQRRTNEVQVRCRDNGQNRTRRGRWIRDRREGWGG